MIIEWGNGSFTLQLVGSDDAPVALAGFAVDSEPESYRSDHPGQPLVEILGPRWGSIRGRTTERLSGTQVGSRLRYQTHKAYDDNGVCVLHVVQEDVASGLRVTSELSAYAGVVAFTSVSRLSVIPGAAPVVVEAVSSFAAPILLSESADNLTVWRGENTNTAEGRWASTPLRSARLAPDQAGEYRLHPIAATSVSSWPSSVFVPAGAVEDTASGRTLAWQVEHNGAWRWEVGECGGSPNVIQAYVSVMGPTGLHHQWAATVTESSPFSSIPVTVSMGANFAEATGRLAQHRRAARRDHPQYTTLPIVFNDWANTLLGRSNEENLQPLIDAAARIGAEYFCLDAGWYHNKADPAAWWTEVGDWQPSTTRYPRGLRWILDYIRDHDMVPGLWMEPEVVGVRSKAAHSLPDSAFVHRYGERVTDRDRHLLDLRDPAARAYLDATVDRLVEHFDIGYLKFDYNMTTGAGIDTVDGTPPGAGLLEHNKALLCWLDSVLDRHPQLVLESCASGGMRSDFATLSRMHLQSTSDQPDPLLIPAIAVGSLVHILPEQLGNWTFPQPAMSPDMIAFCMATGIAGRMVHAGRVDLMTEAQLELVRQGVAVHKAIRGEIAVSRPIFPTGLPTWDDPWVTVAYDGPQAIHLIVWRVDSGPGSLDLNPGLGALSGVQQIYPVGDDTWSCRIVGEALHIVATSGPSARVYRCER